MAIPAAPSVRVLSVLLLVLCEVRGSPLPLPSPHKQYLVRSLDGKEEFIYFGHFGEGRTAHGTIHGVTDRSTGITDHSHHSADHADHSHHSADHADHSTGLSTDHKLSAASEKGSVTKVKASKRYGDGKSVDTDSGYRKYKGYGTPHTYEQRKGYRNNDFGNYDNYGVYAVFYDYPW